MARSVGNNRGVRSSPIKGRPNNNGYFDKNHALTGVHGNAADEEQAAPRALELTSGYAMEPTLS